ncbi:MAG TPA: MnhB domain-containing protein, partial [Pseudonocardia sp.]|nr:MnhB domain-containing protein [Pseudonocardia sp.]
MSRRVRFVVFAVGVAGLLALLVAAAPGMPPFGGASHPYRDRAVAAALAQHTANVVSSVNFDQRGMDTLGEEVILLASVLAASVLLRPARDERVRAARSEPVLPTTSLLGYLLLPVTLLVGLDVVTHGAVTPGGGFQGGVVLATGLHLLYLAGS